MSYAIEIRGRGEEFPNPEEIPEKEDYEELLELAKELFDGERFGISRLHIDKRIENTVVRAELQGINSSYILARARDEFRISLDTAMRPDELAELIENNREKFKQAEEIGAKIEMSRSYSLSETEPLQITTGKPVEEQIPDEMIEYYEENKKRWPGVWINKDCDSKEEIRAAKGVLDSLADVFEEAEYGPYYEAEEVKTEKS